MLIGVIIIASFLLAYLFYLCKKYKDSEYYKVTQMPYFSVLNDPGHHGEFLIYNSLKKWEAHGVKFLFNVYIPKSNGGTTEIDVLMISPKGILVFESKNYSGWIFGNENQKNWYQTLSSGKGKVHKEAFYNPIMQNKSHINHLQNLLGERIPLHSIIVFSNNCTLKDIQIYSPDVTLINRARIKEAVENIYNISNGISLNVQQVNDLYNKLYPYTQVSDSVKAQHIENIKNPANHYSSTNEKFHSKTSDYTTYHSAKSEGNSTERQANARFVNQEQPHCPRCNGYLVLRTSKKEIGVPYQFYGCSNYPKCRYIKKIK